MEFKEIYTDNSVLAKGKYRYIKLSKIPADYFLNIYFKENKNGKYPDKALIEYITKNMNSILDRIDKEPEEFDDIIGYKNVGKFVQLICMPTGKRIFISEKDAKLEIRRIQGLEQDGKKPERSYECEKCGGWHITSIPHEEWEKIIKADTT